MLTNAIVIHNLLKNKHNKSLIHNQSNHYYELLLLLLYWRMLWQESGSPCLMTYFLVLSANCDRRIRTHVVISEVGPTSKNLLKSDLVFGSTMYYWCNLRWNLYARDHYRCPSFILKLKGRVEKWLSKSIQSWLLLQRGVNGTATPNTHCNSRERPHPHRHWGVSPNCPTFEL